MAFPSLIFGRCGAISASATRFTQLHGNNNTTPVATEANARSVMSSTGTLKNWDLKQSQPSGVGTSVTWTLVKNGVATGMVIVISGATDVSGTDTDSAHWVDYISGDVFSVQSVPAGTPFAVNATWSVESLSEYQQILTGDIGAVSNSASTYLSLQNSLAMASAASCVIPLPTGGSYDGLVLDGSLVAGAGKSYTAYFVKNGVDSLLSTSISGAAQTQNSDFTHAISTSRLDTAYIRIDPAGTPTASRLRLGLRFLGTLVGESVQTGQVTGNLANSGNNFGGVHGGVIISATETLRQNWIGSTPFSVYNLHNAVDVAPGAAASGDKWNNTIRSNSANTAITNEILETAVANSDLTHSVTPTARAFLGVNMVGTSAPTGSTAQWSYVMYSAPVSTGRTSRLAMLGVS